MHSNLYQLERPNGRHIKIYEINIENKYTMLFFKTKKFKMLKELSQCLLRPGAKCEIVEEYNKYGIQQDQRMRGAIKK